MTRRAHCNSWGIGRAVSRPAVVAAASLAVLLMASVSHGDESKEKAGPENAATTISTEVLRTRMETAMGEIGDNAVSAKADKDLVRVACVSDKQQRAADVMALGTTEMMVIRDRGSSPGARDFAAEKLQAAADRMDGLVDEARACAGEQGPEEKDNSTRTDADEPRSIPLQDPTGGIGTSPVPPAGGDGWPPVASPFE